jgi:RecA/RadA recombinase
MAPDTKNRKFMSKLQALDGAVVGERNVHNYVIRSPSPSLNMTFGNAHGLPAGYTLVLYGPPKGGKSVISNAMAGQLHKDDPDAWVVKFNTEFREGGQLDDKTAAMWGIDTDRYIAYEVNQPDQIFDRIEKELLALSQEGMKLKLVIIDSLTQIQGRRAMNADTVMTQQIGDNALTIQDGLRRILPVQRKIGFGLILTAHIRAQLDVTEQMRGNKFRPALAFGAQHHAEYSMWVEPNLSKEGRTDLGGQTFINESVEDLNGKGEKLGHKIKVKMKDSSLGPKERQGEFTLDYRRGIINTHEEVFLLGTGYNVIKKPNLQTYSYDGKDFRGKPAILAFLKNDPGACEKILTELRMLDMAGALSVMPEQEASPVEE